MYQLKPKMPKYFKDQKFMLTFSHSETGIFIDNPQDLIVSSKTNETLVIAARGDEVVHGYTLTDVSQSDEKSSPNAWSKAVRFLLVLAYDDGSNDPDDVDLSEVSFCEVKRGGTELVSEFLLSNFIGGSTINWHRRDGQPIGEEESNFTAFMLGDMDPTLYEKRFDYDFSLAGDFNNLALTELIDIDEDNGPEYSKPVFQFGINQKAVSYLDGLVDIPYRVSKILSDEQKKALADEVPGIIRKELDYIAIKLLGQPVQNYQEDRARAYGRMRAAAWAADMYDFCVGDGVGNAYLGDGLSITTDGQITDD